MNNKLFKFTNYYKSGGIHINPKNKGKFTESAHKAGMGVQEFARHVLANKEDYSSTQVKRANFARNAKTFKHQDGTEMFTPAKSEHAPILAPQISPELRRIYSERAAFGELKQDDSSWYKKYIVDPAVTWLNTRPGGPLVSLLKVASSFVPGVGEALDLAEGRPGWAAVGSLPLVGDAAQALSKTGREAKRAANVFSQMSDAQRLRDFKLGAGKTFYHYEDVINNPQVTRHVVQNNAEKFKTTSFVPDLEQIVTNNNIRVDFRNGSRHPYRYQKEGDRWMAYVTPGHRNDPHFAGAKFGSESVLANATRSTAPNSVYMPNNLRYLFRPDLQEDAFKAVADLMASKVMTKTTSQFGNITDDEIYKVAQEAWNRKI